MEEILDIFNDKSSESTIPFRSFCPSARLPLYIVFLFPDFRRLPCLQPLFSQTP